MIPAIKKVIFSKRINTLLKKYQITILHYLPGRIRLGSPLWKKETNTLNYLIEELKKEKRIHSISYTKETGSLLVIYDASPIYDSKHIEKWFQIVEKVLNDPIR
jgi:hypothetical protein